MIYDDTLDIRWTCPNGHDNLDNFHLTVFPYCEECKDSFKWDDVISLEDFDRLNIKHAQLLHDEGMTDCCKVI